MKRRGDRRDEEIEETRRSKRRGDRRDEEIEEEIGDGHVRGGDL
jgi:hypothetical protein